MKKIIYLVAILISNSVYSQTCPTQHTRSDSVVACKLKVKNLTNGLVKFSSIGNASIAVPGTDYSTPSSVHDSLGHYLKLVNNASVTVSNPTHTITFTASDIQNSAVNDIDLQANGVAIGADALCEIDANDMLLQAGQSFNIVVTNGLGLNTGNQNAIIKADNVSGSAKTFQHPNANGIYVLNDNTVALTNKTYNGVTLSGSSTPTLAVTGTATVSGANTGDQTSVSGSAGSAPAGALTGTTINSSVTASSLVSFGTSPSLVAPLLGTPTSGVLTNCTGVASGLTAGNVTTNANLTGPITSVGNATSIASQTGTGSIFAMKVSPQLTMPNIDMANGAALNFNQNISATSWTTSGIKLKYTPARLTNTTSSGTVAAQYDNVIGGDTLHSTSSTTLTNPASFFIKKQIVGTNTTITNTFALAMDGGIVFPSGTGNIIIRHLSASTIFFGTSNATAFNINSSNKVFIGGGGTTSGTAYLHLAAGTATASTAPLKLTSGTNLTTTEAGAVEYDGTHLYYSAVNSGPRYTLDRQAIGGSVSTTGTATTTFTVTIGATQANSTYKVTATPSNVLSAAVFYINNKTTTTFDVVYLAGLTGAVAFDWILTP